MSTPGTYKLNRNIANDVIDMPYPCVEIHNPVQPVAVVITSMPDGDLPVICYVNDALRQIKTVPHSALSLNVLRKVSKITYHKSASESYEITSGLKAVEVI